MEKELRSAGSLSGGGCEFQSLISYARLHQRSLHNDGSADAADADGDRFNNWQEWRAGTDPPGARSILRLLPRTPQGANFVVTWKNVPG